mmetsp:Transcript_50371/g.116274  ORF Transcript_50371/g.116274 Transcript_50371/m.116274 type:complete len:571 (-) Transcript_50371:183-1895(-)
MEPETFPVYVRLWLLSQTLILAHDQFLVPHRAWNCVLAVLYVAAAARPSRATAVAAMLVHIAMHLKQAPAIWDSCWWAIITDATFVGAALLCCSEEEVIPTCAHLIRWEMGLFYTGAGFWKMNSSFLDPRVSCASIYVASLASFLPESLAPRELLRPALALAPHMTIAGELLLGISLLWPRRCAWRFGTALAMLLHYAIALAPFPNQVAAFGVFCSTRLFLAMPEAWAAAIAKSVARPFTPADLDKARGRKALDVSMWVGAHALVASSVRFTSTPGVHIDWCIPAQTALGLIGAYACILDARLYAHATRATPVTLTTKRAMLLRVGGGSTLALTLSYVFLFQPFGLMDVSATSPFSQIRQHGGSNHLLMPTSLLQQWHAHSWFGDKFGGGVVRVTHTTSEYMNALYPGNCTDELQPRVAAILRLSGHIGQQFKPSVNVMLGHDIRAQLPHWQPSTGKPFPAYTVPGVQLRRMLAESRALNESFTLSYTVLPNVVGDEAWRHHAEERQVRVEEDGQGARHCHVRLAGHRSWRVCTDDELALQPAPEGPLMKIMLWFPYPIIQGLDELPCID